MGLSFLSIIVSFIPFIGALIVFILLWPALCRAGYLVARQGHLSFGEVFRDTGHLRRVSAYYLILGLIPGILIGVGYILVRHSAGAGLSEAYTEDGYGGMSGSMAFSGTGGILVVAGLIILFILSLFGWAGPYAILSGRAGIFDAIGQSFSLTAQNFGKVFLALLSYIGLLIFVPISVLVVSLKGFDSEWTLVGYLMWILMWYLIVLPMGSIFLPLLYFALTDEEGVSHA